MTQTHKPKAESKAPSMIAWHVAEGRDRNYWTRIGAAWPHEDGEGWNIKLNLYPIDGRLVLRAPKDRDEAEGDAAG